MFRVQRTMASAAIAFLGLVGISGAAAAAPSDSVGISGVTSATSSDSAEITPRGRLIEGGWQFYQSGFKSQGSCESRAATLLETYRGNWVGGMVRTNCVKESVPACPQPNTTYTMYATFWKDTNIPNSVDPEIAAVASAPAPAAC